MPGSASQKPHRQFPTMWGSIERFTVVQPSCIGYAGCQGLPQKAEHCIAQHPETCPAPLRSSTHSRSGEAPFQGFRSNFGGVLEVKDSEPVDGLGFRVEG